jgi:signal transduction histidine kinase
VLRGDRERLGRVLRNLIENGVKFSPKDTPVRVTLDRDVRWAMIVVKDQGVGIPAEDLPRVFERFFRAATAAEVKGTGLGLAGARAIVDRHGGEITIESTVGQGTTVTVRLPR